MKNLIILLLTTLCFATRFQTIWEKMEFPVDTTLPPFCFGLRCCGIGDVNGDGYDDFLVNKIYGSDIIDTNLTNKVLLFLGKNILSKPVRFNF